MFKKILVANRGEIACRIIRSASELGIRTVAVFSDVDSGALHVKMADEAVHIGPPQASKSYLSITKILKAVQKTGAEAVHPGYGFQSENKDFAEALDAEGVAFIGPPASAIEAMGDKITAKKLATDAGVPTVPGYLGLVESADKAVRIATEIGFPVMIKASAGGGGKGMRVAWDEDEVREGFQSSRNEAASSFGDDRIFVEKFISSPRHIEIQVLADKFGNCVFLNERECSIQRRNQKVIEEAPSPFLDEKTRREMGAKAVSLAKAVGYHSAGTVEFIVDSARNFYFLEMNTRLQVEHPVTELITGVDLVAEMINIAAGEPLKVKQKDVIISGWAFESRIYAEDPHRKFLPSIGRLTRYRPPREGAWGAASVRNDTGVFEGGEISVHYDPMIAKLCSWGEDRDKAMDCMRECLDSFEIEGIACNLPFLSAVFDNARFIFGEISTSFIADEFPDGFSGVEPPARTLQRLVAAASVFHVISETRRAQISGQLPNHVRKVGSEWNVSLDSVDFDVQVSGGDEVYSVSFLGGTEVKVESSWHPGQTLTTVLADDGRLTLKVDSIEGGFRIRHRGVDIKALVRSPRHAELGGLMAKKLPPDTSKKLLCPMPGLLVSLQAGVGDEVESGQALCVVEAMKMENILKAERKARVKSILAKPGDILAVDEVILEFE